MDITVSVTFSAESDAWQQEYDLQPTAVEADFRQHITTAVEGGDLVAAVVAGWPVWRDIGTVTATVADDLGTMTDENLVALRSRIADEIDKRTTNEFIPAVREFLTNHPHDFAPAWLVFRTESYEDGYFYADEATATDGQGRELGMVDFTRSVVADEITEMSHNRRASDGLGAGDMMRVDLVKGDIWYTD